MRDEQDLTAVIEAAWTSFRGRLADHVAAMDDDDVVVVEYDLGVELEGASPYVQLIAFGDGQVRAEAVGNAYLDESVELDAEQEEALLDLGWRAPRFDDGEDNFHDLAELCEADRVAVLLVRTLREVYGVPHPAFLSADGLETDPVVALEADRSLTVGPDDAHDVHHDETDETDGSGDEHDHAVGAVVPRSRRHLQDLVDAAMEVVYPDLVHDDDGDIPIAAGRSRVFVRVLADRPAVELYSEVVLDPVDRDRLALELGLLNRTLPMWKVFVNGDVVVMRHELMAVPFSGMQLRLLVDRFVDDVDDVAGDLAARVGGRRFHDPAPAQDADADVDDADLAVDVDGDDLAVVGLLELLHLGRPRAATVAGLFDHDRGEIIRQIVRLRTGRQSCGEHDLDDVLTVLRKALRLVSDGEQRPAPVPPQPRTVQASLLTDADLGDDTLDIGWSA